MIKKTLIIVTIALLFCSMIIPTTIAAEDNDIKKTASMVSLVKVDWDSSDEPIMPGEIRYIDINITYDITQGGLLSSLLFPFFKSKQVDVNLGIVDTPEWCTASLAVSTLTTTIGAEDKNMTTKLAIELDEDAPAYAAGYVKLNASVEPFKGPFGIITYIDGFQQDFTVKFTPAYLPIIDPEFSEGNFYEITPYNATTIPISITNLGNAETTVFTDIVNHSESWAVTIDSDVTIGVGETKTINLTLQADHKFDEETVKIKFTPARSENKADIGEPIFLTLILENDGSYVEEDNGFEIDIGILIIILVIIAFIVLVITILKRK